MDFLLEDQKVDRTCQLVIICKDSSDCMSFRAVHRLVVTSDRNRSVEIMYDKGIVTNNTDVRMIIRFQLGIHNTFQVCCTDMDHADRSKMSISSFLLLKGESRVS